MKTQIKRGLSILCLLSLMLGLLPALSPASAKSFEATAAIGRGLNVTRLNSLESGNARQLFMLDYTPGGAVSPMVAYGSKLYGKSDINYAVQYAESLGYTVLAAVNADFFNLDTGIPTGMLIQNGRLCVSDGQWNSVAFFPDGTAMTGTPRLSMSYTRLSNGQVHSIYALNKVRTQNGIYLYTDDFSTTTRTTAAGAEVVLEVAPGDFLRLGQPLSATVVDIRRTAPNTPLGPNQMVLSLTESNTVGATFGDLAVGETLIINASTADPRWHGAIYSCGGGNLLAQNGQLLSAAGAGKDPRTVIGVRPDGSFSVLVCDGRQKGLSDGISLEEAARLLIARGCTEVINMDGGGSTALSYADAGYSGATVKNAPSDGALRKCANYILFVNSGDSTLPESTVTVYPQNAIMLAGASLSLEGRSYNDDYFPKGAHSGGFYVSSGGGDLEGSTFTAPMSGGLSTLSIDAYGLKSVDATVEVVDRPDAISFVRTGTTTPLTTLAVGLDSVTDLDLYITDGLRQVICQDTQFELSTTGNVGTIDQNGVLTAGSVPGLSGTVVARWQDYEVTLPVTVGKAPLVLDTFEGEPVYTVTGIEEGSSANGLITLSKAPENARYGYGSLYLTYDVKLPHETLRFAAEKAYALTGGANIVSLLAKGKGDFGVDFVTPDGIQRVPITLTEDWQYITVPVPSDATAVAGFSASGEQALTGAVYIDQLMAHFGTAPNDIEPPQIVGLAFDPETLTLTASASDNYPMPITGSMVSLTIDGTPLPFTYDEATGALSATLTEVPQGLHRLTLTVHDYFLNTTRKSVTIGQTAETVFEDLNGHWSQDYIEYLRTQGIFDAEPLFRPEEKVYNEMAATMISRFLKTDVSLYEDLEMPFIDADQISDWAWPHVKAMYYEGVMVGSYDSAGNRIYNPRAATSRAQVMTILGRTIPRGYAYPAAPFADYETIPLWARDHVNLLYSMEIVNGYAGSNTVAPLGTITRAEVASLFFKIY